MSKELNEKDVSNVTGGGRSGGGVNTDKPDQREIVWEQKAYAFFNSLQIYVPFPCPYCYAASNGHYSVYAKQYSDYHNEYRVCKCFACERDHMNITNGRLS